MLDFFLVLGIVPGTSIQLNFFEIITLPFLIFILFRHQNYARLYYHINNRGKAALRSGSFRGFIIWAALALDRPHAAELRHRLSR
jgi:hypothetical protein